MSKPTTKNRKRRKGTTIRPAGFSKSLWEARNLISLGQNDQGLAALNQLATNTKNPKRRAKILMLVGESQARLSRHTEAVAAYARASDFARQAADLDILLCSSSGQIRSLLRSLRADEAKTVATSLLAEFDKAQQDYQKILDLTPAQLAAKGTVNVTAQPPRPTVILTKIANTFIESGLTDDARVFLQKALALSPNGAARARQSMAKLALASDDPALAERYARESLLMGRFQAKTIAAWQLYLDARARQNLVPILEPDVFTSFQANATGRIASASIQSITRVLRGHGDPSWKGFAQSAIASPKLDPIISAELEKIIQADAKMTDSEDSRSIAARALRMFRSSGTSAQEQISHAKAYARYCILSGDQPKFDVVIKVGTARYGIAHSITVRHAMALGAIQARGYDLARKCFMALLTDLQPGIEAWGRATWALARMEEGLENHGEASVWYFELAENKETPSRFRIQAVLRGFKQLASSGGAVDTTKVRETVSSVLNDIDDYRVSLDAARQLALAGAPFLDLKLAAAERGKSLADLALEKAASPRERLAIFEYVARRQAWDLGDYTSILDRWDRLTAGERLEYKAMSGSLWYEYTALIFKALTSNGRVAEAEAVVGNIIDRDQSTPEGYVIVGTEYAEWLMKKGERVRAFDFFDWIAKESPTHRRAAVAHYWIALRNFVEGKVNLTKSSAENIRRCFGGAPALLEEWELDCSALILIANCGISSQEIVTIDNYDFNFVEKCKATISRNKQIYFAK